jgi:diguanylate cyclase (GGDEF)-like protein
MANDNLVQRFLLYSFIIGLICALGSFFIVHRASNLLIANNLQTRFLAASTTLNDILRWQEKKAVNNSRMLTKDVAFRLAYQNRRLPSISTILNRFQLYANANFIQLRDLNKNILWDTRRQNTNSTLEQLNISPEIFQQAIQSSSARSLMRIGNVTYSIITIPLQAPTHVGWLIYAFPFTQTIAEQILRETGSHISLLSSQQGQGVITLSTLPGADTEIAQATFKQLRWTPNVAFQIQLETDGYTSIAQQLSGTQENGSIVFYHYPLKSKNAFWWPILITFLGSSIAVITLGMGLSYVYSSRLVDTLIVIGRNLRLIVKGRQPNFPRKKFNDDRSGLIDACLQLVTYVNNLTHTQQKDLDVIRERNYELNTELRAIKRRLFQAELMLEVVNATHFMTKPVEIVGHILHNIISRFRFERASIMILNEDTNELDLKLVKKWDPSTNEIKTVTPESKVRLKKNEGIAGLTLESGRAHVAESGYQDQLFKKYEDDDLNETVNSIICLPLKKRTSTFGVINISTSKPRGLILKNDMDLLEKIAAYASLAIGNARLYTASIVDPLTQVYKSRYIMERLKSELQMARRTQTLLSIFAIEIDNSETQTTRFGSQVFNRLLQAVAEILTETLRKTDLIGRYQNNLFLVILPHTDKAAAQTVAEKILRIVNSEHIITSAGPIQVTLSIGVVTISELQSRTDKLVSQAMTALTNAKREGGDKMVIAEDLQLGT